MSDENKENKKVINSVRQVLMNELGLTRESIKLEINKIIAETTEKYLRNPAMDSRIQSVIETTVTRALNPNIWDRTKLADHVKTEVLKEVKTQIGNLIVDRLAINLEIKPEKGEQE